jgi:hypothetical protein
MGHQTRLAWRDQPLAKALARAALYCSIGGILYPPLLAASLVLIASSGVVILDTLVRPSEL